MKVKSSVRFGEINQYFHAFVGACLEYEAIYHDELTLTSANDSKHSAKSFHYEDKAWDLRANDKSDSERKEIIRILKHILGYGWDVILETPADPAKHHFHIERDTRNYPK